LASPEATVVNENQRERAVTAMKVVAMAALVVLPGGLLLLGAFALARLAAANFKRHDGSRLRWGDVVREFRALRP
jgi:hypothetical protein